MASTWCCKATSIVSYSAVRRRLPLVGAFCMLSLGLSSSSFKTGCAQSLPFASFLRSRLGYQSIHSTRMEGNNSTVPSIVVYVTVPNKEAGKKLAESIVKEKLAACVNRVPVFQKACEAYASRLPSMWGEQQSEVLGGNGIESVYQWQGEIQTDSEELLIIKTRESLLEALTEHVKANHEYDVPEVIALPITGGSLQYLEWIKNSTRD